MQNAVQLSTIQNLGKEQDATIFLLDGAMIELLKPQLIEDGEMLNAMLDLESTQIELKRNEFMIKKEKTVFFWK